MQAIAKIKYLFSIGVAAMLLSGCLSSSDSEDVNESSVSVVFLNQLTAGDDLVEVNWANHLGVSFETTDLENAEITVHPEYGSATLQGEKLVYVVDPYTQADSDVMEIRVQIDDVSYIIEGEIRNIDHEPSVSHVYLTMESSDLDELYSRDPFSDDRLPAYVQFGPNDIERGVEMRFRGNTTRNEPKKGYNIRFNDGEQDWLFATGDRINARAMWRDPSFVREHMAMWFFREIGLHSPRTKYFKLFINGSFEGLYMHVERIDRRYSRARDLNRDATLVRDEFRSVQDLPCVKAPTAFGENNFASIPYEEVIACLQQGFDDRRVDWDTVAEFVIWLDTMEPGELFAQELEQRVDVDYLIPFFGAHILLGDRDALWGNDYWWQKDHTTEGTRWIFFPWDKNLSLGSHSRGANPDNTGFGSGNLFFPFEYTLENMFGQNRLFSYIVETPSLRTRLEDWLYEMMDAPEFNESFHQELERVVALTKPHSINNGFTERRYVDREFEVNQENRLDLYGVHEEHVEQVTEYLDLRKNHLRALLGGMAGERHVTVAYLDDMVAAGETISFVDGYGFTLGKLTPANDLPAGTELKLSARPIESQDVGSYKITHEWLFESSADLNGRLSVYYRNDSGIGTQPNSFSRSNWYAGGMRSIGEQPAIVPVSGNENLVIDDFEIRPLVNRIDMQVDVSAMSAPVYIRGQ